MSKPDQNATQSSEPDYAKSGRTNTNSPFYVRNIDKYLVPETKLLLGKYGGVPEDEQSELVHRIRDQAWAVRAYPCTGLGVWLVPFIARSPAYEIVKQRLCSGGGCLLDVGCFIGADLRQLAFDGADTTRLYGMDIVKHWDIGFELYHDRGRFHAHFIEADILSDDKDLQQIPKAVDVISVSAVLHQWNWSTQLAAVQKLIAFSKRNTIVLGYQIGRAEHCEVKGIGHTTQYLQSPESFAELWREASRATGTKWRVEAHIRTWEHVGWDAADMGWLDPQNRPLDFVVTRED